MDIARFELEFWLNPLDDKAEYNFGSSCCKPVTVGEMLELTGTDREAFFREVEGMSLHYGYFDGMPRLKRAIAALYDGSVAPEMVISVHGGTGANSIVCQALCGPGMNVVCVLPSYQQHYSIPASSTTRYRRRSAPRCASTTAARARNTAWTSKKSARWSTAGRR